MTIQDSAARFFEAGILLVALLSSKLDGLNPVPGGLRNPVAVVVVLGVVDLNSQSNK